MAYWLLKSEPDAYPFAQLQRDGETLWDGVRNFQAAKNLRAMAVGDEAFFYHSNIGREVVGLCTVSGVARPDPGDPAGRFVAVMVRAGRPLARPVTLAAIKADPAFRDFALVRQSRLSVVPVTPAEWRRILALGAG